MEREKEKKLSQTEGERYRIERWEDMCSCIFPLFFQVGDQFMGMIEQVAAFLPYMTCPGNHGKA